MAKQAWIKLWNDVRERAFKGWSRCASEGAKIRRYMRRVKQRKVMQHWIRRTKEKINSQDAKRKAKSMNIRKTMKRTLYLFHQAILSKKRINVLAALIKNSNTKNSKQKFWEMWKAGYINSQKTHIQKSTSSEYYSIILKKKVLGILNDNAKLKKFSEINKSISVAHNYGSLLKKVVNGWKFLAVYNKSVRTGYWKTKRKLDRKLLGNTYCTWKANYKTMSKASKHHKRILCVKAFQCLSKWYFAILNK